MESFQENVLLYNLTAGIVVLVLFLLILKFMESLGKTLLIFIGVVIVGYGLLRFFPHFVEPVVRFIGISWMNNEEVNDDDSATQYEVDTYYDSSSNYNGSGLYNDGGLSDESGIYDNSNIYDGSNPYLYDDSNVYDDSVIYDDSYLYDESDIYYDNNYDHRNVEE